MYSEIQDGSFLDVPDNSFGFTFRCWVPPIGYGINSMTGQLEETDILKRSDIPEEQYWERIPLPADYKKRRLQEKKVQQIDKDYFDPELEDFRRKDWRRRLSGVWFWRYNPRIGKSELVYLTGQQFLYINWWVYQGKYMDYREPDRETFYVYQYCQEDPFCLGTNEIMQRKNGKTGRTGCVGYERTSRLPFHHCGIQSKSDDDGWGVFKKAFVQPWRKLPDFYRPVFDTMKGDDPNDELRFFATSRRGQQTEFEEPEEALESWVDFATSEEGGYDGPELHTYISDETGKTRREVSVKERQRVVKMASIIDGEIRGFHMFTTTVEVEENEEENVEFEELTAQSNPLNRNENGMTMSGLYTFFQPAYKYMYFDKYGFPNEERAKTFLLNERKKFEDEGDTRGLSSIKRKKPMTFREAFSSDGLKTLYDPELINIQLDNIKWRINEFIEKGDLEWEGGFEFVIEKIMPDGTKQLVPNKLNWVPKPNGKYEKVKGWLPDEPNSVYENNGFFSPNNNVRGRIGCDPFKYDKTKDKRRSNCAAFYYQMPDPLYPENEFDDMFTLKYSLRPDGTDIANMDILKMAWWCGCQVLFERNVNHWKRDFEIWKTSGFLTWMPGEVEPGIYTRGNAVTSAVQTVCNYTEAYINKHISKVYFPSLLRKETGWLGFKVEDTEKFDEPMAAGITLVAVKGKKYIRSNDRKRDVESILPLRKAM
jgi:hypothetical protein